MGETKLACVVKLLRFKADHDLALRSVYVSAADNVSVRLIT
jgi:hypothetical protein